MLDDKNKWKQFQKLKFDGKKLSKRVKKAEGATVRHARKFLVSRLDNMRDVRRHIIGWLLLVGVMIVVVGLQMMWYQQSYQATAAASGGTYAEAVLGPIDTLNPLFASTSAELASSRLLFSSLYAYDKTGHLHGDLAKKMTVDEAGTTYTIALRSDATWHDGEPLTAHDVAFTVNLIKNPSTRSPLRSNWQDVIVKATDDATVQFVLPASYAAFDHALTFSVLPKHILQSVEPSTIRENTFSRAPVGSGPFSFRLLQNVDAKTHRAVHMTAYDAYYRGEPMINRFEIHAYTNPSEILTALRTGQVSAAADLAAVDLAQINQDNYTITVRPVNGGVYAMLNVDSPVLQDKKVRQALQAATDTSAIRDNLAVSVPALDSPFVQGQLTGDDVPHPSKPDDKRAAALLDAAGWKLDDDGIRKNKKGESLTLTIATTKNPHYEKSLESLVGQWRQLGLTINTNIVDTSAPSTNFVRDTLQARNYDVLLYELSIGADPDVYAYWHSSQTGSNGYNFSNYKNDTADAALASARSRIAPELRNVKYKAFAEQWLEDVPAIGLYQTVAEYVSSKGVQSIGPRANLISSYDRYADILYWSVNQESVYKTP